MRDYTISEMRKIEEAYLSVLNESSSSKMDDKPYFNYIGEWDAKRIIASISRRTDNKRMNVNQFKKYYKDPKKRWFGVFIKGKCMALSVIKRTPQKNKDNDFRLLAEIQTIIKGYGKILIEELMRRYDNLWWAADPDGGNELLDYYRQFSDMTEFKVKLSGWSGTKQSFFYKCSDSKHRKMIVDLLKSVECGGKKAKKIDFPKEEISELSKKPVGERFYTTRVSDDYERFGANDFLYLPWKNRRGYVTRVWDFDSIEVHPFKDELTEKQKKFLSDYSKFKVLEIEIIKS